MSVDILLIDARWDPTTDYLQYFREYFLKNDLANYSVKSLISGLANKYEIDKVLRTNRVKYITAAGHGEYDLFRGYHNDPIWKAGHNLSNVKGTIVHLLSCKTGRLLGRDMIQQGARAFWGYTEDFKFVRKIPTPSHIHTDTLAGDAILMDCLIDIGILRNHDANRIYDEVCAYFKITTQGMPASSAHRAAMLHNLNHLVCPALYYGRRNATI